MEKVLISVDVVDYDMEYNEVNEIDFTVEDVLRPPGSGHFGCFEDMIGWTIVSVNYDVVGSPILTIEKNNE